MIKVCPLQNDQLSPETTAVLLSNGRKVWNCDVWDYLEDLIEDESLDYTVYDGDKTYGVLDYKETEDE